MPVNFAKVAKPSDFDLRMRLIGSPLQNTEMELVAANIILISQQNGDEWTPFSWEEYKARCSHKVSLAESGILEMLSKKGVLDSANGEYSINDSFIETLHQFIRAS